MPSRGTAEERGGPRADAGELRHGLGAEAAAVEGAPPLQSAGVAAMPSRGTAEASGGARAAAVELRHGLGAEAAAVEGAPPLQSAASPPCRRAGLLRRAVGCSPPPSSCAMG
eukprot:scaffold10867_cov23-Phaeocystis_antarctica.AAC.1